MDWMVQDARNNRTIGPYSRTDAETMARDLNAYVLRYSVPVVAQLGATSKGPFYVRRG